MSTRRCKKLENGFLDYEYNETEHYIQIMRDIPETGNVGGTFSKNKFSFDSLNSCLQSFGEELFAPVKITAFYNISCSNTGSMLTAILIDLGVVKKVRQGDYQVIGKL